MGSDVAAKWWELKQQKASSPLRTAVYSSLWPGIAFSAGATYGLVIVVCSHECLSGCVPSSRFASINQEWLDVGDHKIGGRGLLSRIRLVWPSDFSCGNRRDVLQIF